MNTKLIAFAVAGIAWAAAHAQAQETSTYVAELHPMNSKVTGAQTTGEARFTIAGDTLTISINVQGAPPDIEHWQHFHGFKDNRNATCPTPSADTNHDGIIDLIETGPMSGTTMVPFNGNPVAMDIPAETYPKASADGSYHYQKEVSLKALEAGFAKALGDRNLDLDRRVVFIHGVPASTKLPSSVASLGPYRSHCRLPAARSNALPGNAAANLEDPRMNSFSRSADLYELSKRTAGIRARLRVPGSAYQLNVQIEQLGQILPDLLRCNDCGALAQSCGDAEPISKRKAELTRNCIKVASLYCDLSIGIEHLDRKRRNSLGHFGSRHSVSAQPCRYFGKIDC